MIGVSDMLDMHPDVMPYYDKLVAWGKSAGDCTDEWMVYEYTKEMLDVLGLDPEKLEQALDALERAVNDTRLL